MQQDLFSTNIAISAPSKSAVNVASVPHRSPFRYPGGKTWFVPAFRKWMQTFKARPSLLIEPFAGGATVALTAVCEDLVEHAVLIELDPDIASVWKVVVDGDAPLLAQRIIEFDLSVDTVLHHISLPIHSELDRAFTTLLKNRTYHGGILAPGSGLLKNGEAGRGIASRWYPATLAKRLLTLHLVRHRLSLLCADALVTMREYAKDEKATFFIDPPYSLGGKKAGSRLYTYYELNHELLFATCADLLGEFVMTYDDAAEVRDMAAKYQFKTALIPMKNTHHAAMTELVVGRDLSWL